jgi:hypothetical protein
MTVSVDHFSEIHGLQLVMRDTLASIDAALDRGDRRAFRAWCKKWASLSARAGAVLVELARAET